MEIVKRCVVAILVACSAGATLRADDVGSFGFTGLPPFALSSAAATDSLTGSDVGELSLSALYLPVAVAAPAPDDEGDTPGKWVAAKLGPKWFSGDVSSEFDTGIYAELTFGSYIVKRFLAVQGSVGYFWSGDDDVSGADVDVQGVPFLLELRASIPIAIIEPFAGVGIGGVYGWAEVDLGALDRDDDDVVLAGSIFGGVNVNLGRLFVGLEGKYIVTDRSSDFSSDLDLFALLVSVGFRF